MSGRRVRIRSLEGGTSLKTRNDLMDKLYSKLAVKFTKIITTNDSFIAVCLNDDDVNKLISATGLETLKKHKFEVIVPPHLRAKKTIVLKGLDKEITALNEEEILRDIENRNDWAKVEEIIKMKNIPYMLKIRFKDISMAKKAIDNGLCIQMYHLSKNQVEAEDFIQITPCWVCYKYDHTANSCPKKNEKFCSECAATDHTFRECSRKDSPKCLNCEGAHRTLAAICPIRKQLIKNRRMERQEKKRNFEKENKTFCEVTKLRAETEKVATQLRAELPLTTPQQDTTVLQLDNNMPFKILTIIINAHLINIARPGTFSRSVKEMMSMNGLPEVNLPDNVPSCEIFKVVRSNTDTLDLGMDLQSYHDYTDEKNG